MKNMLGKLSMPSKKKAQEEAELDLDMLLAGEGEPEQEDTGMPEFDLEAEQGAETGPLAEAADDDLIEELKKRGYEIEMPDEEEGEMPDEAESAESETIEEEEMA